MHYSSLWITVEESNCKTDFFPKIDNEHRRTEQNNIKIIYDCAKK